jgi:hypothetical protein
VGGLDWSLALNLNGLEQILVWLLDHYQLYPHSWVFVRYLVCILQQLRQINLALSTVTEPHSATDYPIDRGFALAQGPTQPHKM